MAGSGTAHLRPADETLLRVEHLVVEFPVARGKKVHAVSDAGRLMGLANIGTGGAAAAAGLVGPLIDAWGFSPALLAATLAILLSLLPLARSHPVRTMEGAIT